MTITEIEKLMKGQFTQAKEEMIEEELFGFTNKITPELKERLMKLPLLPLKEELKKLYNTFLEEYAKEA
jgi:hypothetical protein